MTDKRFWRGKTGERTPGGQCSECGGSGFAYNNGFEVSEDGVRGYRCMECETVKPERDPQKPDPMHHSQGLQIVRRIRENRRACAFDRFGREKPFDSEEWDKRNRALCDEFAITLEQWYEFNRLTFQKEFR